MVSNSASSDMYRITYAQGSRWRAVARRWQISNNGTRYRSPSSWNRRSRSRPSSARPQRRRRRRWRPRKVPCSDGCSRETADSSRNHIIIRFRSRRSLFVLVSVKRHLGRAVAVRRPAPAAASGATVHADRQELSRRQIQRNSRWRRSATRQTHTRRCAVRRTIASVHGTSFDTSPMQARII